MAMHCHRHVISQVTHSQRPVLVPGHHVLDRSLTGLALGLALPFRGLGACPLATKAAAGGGEVDSPRDLQGGVRGCARQGLDPWARARVRVGAGFRVVAGRATFIATSAASSSSLVTPGTKHSAMTKPMRHQYRSAAHMRMGPLMKAPRQYLARGATAEGKVVGAEDGGAMDAAMDWCT